MPGAICPHQASLSKFTRGMTLLHWPQPDPSASESYGAMLPSLPAVGRILSS